MIYIGFDPGVITGWSVLQYNGEGAVFSNAKILGHGKISIDFENPFQLLLELEEIANLIPKGETVQVGVETQYLDQSGDRKEQGAKFNSIKKVIIVSGMLLMGCRIVFGIHAQWLYPSAWQGEFNISGPSPVRKKLSKNIVKDTFGYKVTDHVSDAILMSVFQAIRAK